MMNDSILLNIKSISTIIHNHSISHSRGKLFGLISSHKLNP